MKSKNHFILFAFTIIIFTNCKKEKAPEDPHNHSLLNKSLDEIRSEIAGKWQLKRSHFQVCGVAGCDTTDTPYPNNTGDYVYFLANDTVKQTGVSGYPVKIYEKALVSREKSYYTPEEGVPSNIDSIYIFRMSNGYYHWTMGKIKNDSLVVYSGPWTYYLLR